MRKTAVRGRPGLLFLGVLIICLIIFYLSWRTMMSPRHTVVKDIYSPGRQKMEQLQRVSNFRETQRDGMSESFEKARVAAPDQDYNFDNSEEVLSHQPHNQLRGPPNQEFDDLRVGIERHAESRVTTGPKLPTEVEIMVPEKEYYKEPDPSFAPYFNSLDRIVHFDLKGAAMKMPYLQKLIPMLKTLGATGLLVEYEDMFPFAGELSHLAAKNAYSMAQLTEFLQLAKQNNLFVIPLIQTFGHMEFILKEYHDSLRESQYTPQVIDSTSNMSYALIKEMVIQVLSAHPEAKYIHIGCDEVYELGRGKSYNVMVKERLTTEEMFLRHVRQVAGIVSTESKGRVRPIMWDDELRNIPQENIRKSEIPLVVDIMVWRYTPDVEETINSTIWTKYSNLFKSVWVASSFKGATGSRQMYTEVQYHIKNHFSWVDVIKKYKSSLKFTGVVLTGWQRYDHFATLCELFPVALPSVAVCLATLKNGGFDEKIHWKTSSLLNCSRKIEMNFPSIDRKTKKAIVSQDCSFPGSTLYYGMQELWGFTQNSYQHRLDGWLSDYQVAHGFSSTGQLGVLSRQLSELQMNFVHMSSILERELLKIYSDDTVDEWLDENIRERVRNIKEIKDKINILVKKRTWPRRPLPHVEIHRQNSLLAPGIVPNTQQQSINAADQKRKVNNAEFFQDSAKVDTSVLQKSLGQVQNGNSIGTGGHYNGQAIQKSFGEVTNTQRENLGRVNGGAQVDNKQLNSGMSLGQNVHVVSGSQNFNQAAQYTVRQKVQGISVRQNVPQNLNQGGQNAPVMSNTYGQNTPQNLNQGWQNAPMMSNANGQNVPQNLNQGGQNAPVMLNANGQNVPQNLNQGWQNAPVMSNSNRQNVPQNLNQGGQNAPVMSNSNRQNVPQNLNQGGQNAPVMSYRQNIPQNLNQGGQNLPVLPKGQNVLQNLNQAIQNQGQPSKKDDVPAVDSMHSLQQNLDQPNQSGYGQRLKNPEVNKNAPQSSQNNKASDNDALDHLSEKTLSQPKPVLADSGKNFHKFDKDEGNYSPQKEEDEETVEDGTEQKGREIYGNVASVLGNENTVKEGQLKRGSMQSRLEGADNILPNHENRDKDQYSRKYDRDPYFLEDGKMKEYERDILLKREHDQEYLN